ncbi:MAG TPA: hypothetical protein VFA39_19685 [Steroidobacteraceae bacterium]|nr:hypothetical protein [Steroidobacteraceae bacterium]
MGHRRASLMLRSAAACILVIFVAAAPAAPAQQSRLAFQVREGRALNYFLREGPVAAHLVLRSGPEPRILVVFPAGNSGVGLWFAHQRAQAAWAIRGEPQPVHARDERGRALYGMSAEATLAVTELDIHGAALSNVRVLRDYASAGTVPKGIAVSPAVNGRTLTWARDRLDGAAGYRLQVEVLDGRVRGKRILAGTDGRIGLRITGLTGEMPLVPLAGHDLLRDPSAGELAARQTLTFLAYREKLLAGSWRFDTYFGRDTLMSLRLLMPALSPAAVGAGLDSVLARLSPRGEVAHEEDIGEQAVLDHLSDGSHSAEPVYDYKMIDEDYLLAPVAAAWMLGPGVEARSAAFLAAPVGGPLERRGARGAALVKNLRYVVQRAAAFAKAPEVAHLIGLKPGVPVGDWRDSGTGLGGGRYPYDVDAVLVPSALEATARLVESGLLSPYLTASDRTLFSGAAQMASIWRKRAPQLFDVTLSHSVAANAIEIYADSQGVSSQSGLAALGAGPLRFHALALAASGEPIPVMHSDEGFLLLFEDPEPEALDRIVSVAMRPFPAGLLTGVGMVVANPVFCAPTLQKLFSRNAYHGTVVWSWQQALFAAGLARQLERRDLPPAVRTDLLRAQRALWSAINATHSMQNSELWSWSYAAGHYQVRPFGSSAADADESNAAQLWSTVYLAVRPTLSNVKSASELSWPQATAAGVAR